MSAEIISQIADWIIVCTFLGFMLTMIVDMIAELSIMLHKEIRDAWKKHKEKISGGDRP